MGLAVLACGARAFYTVAGLRRAAERGRRDLVRVRVRVRDLGLGLGLGC